jgi:MFS transporter, FHS family, L-fucose permease
MCPWQDLELIVLVEERSGWKGPSRRRHYERPHKKARFVYRGLTVPFMLLGLSFAAWGSAANLTDVMVGVFRHIFVISNARSALIQTAHYGGYFSLAIPTAFINKRFRLQDPRAHPGWEWPALGAGLFFPASKLLAFGVCLVALFVVAAGLSIRETSANPFVIAMGPEGIATQRLNLAQAFNPVGANIDALLGAVLILPRITTPGTTLTAPQLHQAQGKGPVVGGRALPRHRHRARADGATHGCTYGAIGGPILGCEKV